MSADPITYSGHCPDLDMEFLVEVYPDACELKTKRGNDQRWTWSPPVRLTREQVIA